MLNTRIFEAKEYDLVLYNGQAAIEEQFNFVYSEDCGETEIDFEFPDFTSAYFRVYNERSGRLLKDLVLTQSGSVLTLNGSVLDMTFEDLGYYYYEIGYVRSVYEQALRYGTLKVI